MEFNVSSNSQSSSLLELGSHTKDYPEVTYIEKNVVIAKRLDAVIPDSYSFDFINLDIQGAELSALRGLGKHLQNARYIYSEVNKKQVYIGCPHISDIDKFLQTYGFRRIATRWVFKKGWGDALWIKTDEIKSIRSSIFKFSVLIKVDLLRQILPRRSFFKH